MRPFFQFDIHQLFQPIITRHIYFFNGIRFRFNPKRTAKGIFMAGFGCKFDDVGIRRCRFYGISYIVVIKYQSCN